MQQFLKTPLSRPPDMICMPPANQPPSLAALPLLPALSFCNGSLTQQDKQKGERHATASAACCHHARKAFPYFPRCSLSNLLTSHVRSPSAIIGAADPFPACCCCCCCCCCWALPIMSSSRITCTGTAGRNKSGKRYCRIQLHTYHHTPLLHALPL